MEELILDLTKDATRGGILAMLRNRMDKAQSAQLDERLSRAQIDDGHRHGLTEVVETIEMLDVSDEVRQDMGNIYSVLAEAEAQVHGCAVEETHFHEVGNGEAIRNTLAICLAFEILNPDRIVATPVQTGKGTVVCAHGELDIPAPATAAIISRGIPVCDERIEGEWCSPTSAAIIFHFVDEYRV